MSNTVEVQERLDQAAVLFAEAKAILLKSDATADEMAQIQPRLDAARKLKADAGQLQDITKSMDDILEHNKLSRSVVTPEPEKKDFANWSEFVEAAWFANHKDAGVRKADQRLRYFRDDAPAKHGESKVMTEGIGASGGFLVPAEFLAQLQSVMAEESLVRGRATVIRMRRRQIGIPVLDQTATTAGIPHWFGGMQFYWGEEAAEKTNTDAKFRKIDLVAHKLYGYTYASDELVDDAAISIGDFLSGPLGFAGGVSWMEDYAFLQGAGAGQPLGVINAGATITVNRAATGTVGLADLLNMLENFLPSGRGMWIYTQSALRELMEINGPAANPSYVFMPSAREGAPDTLFGMPARRSEKVPRIGTAGDFLLADWRYYLIGDRQATTIESTQFDRWRYDETSWRVVHRVDGQPWLSAPLTYQDGTTQVSPFVILGDKST